MNNYTIRNLDNKMTTKSIDNVVLGTAILIKLGLKSLRPLDTITIEDEDGYIVPASEQAEWIKAYTNA